MGRGDREGGGEEGTDSIFRETGVRGTRRRDDDKLDGQRVTSKEPMSRK